MKSLVVSRRAARLHVSHPVTAVSCSQRAGQLHPNFEGIESIGVEMLSKQSESSADDCAQSGTGISSYGVVCTDCSHSFHCCHIGIGSNLQQKNHPRYRITTFIQLGSGAMVSVEQANGIS